MKNTLILVMTSIFAIFLIIPANASQPIKVTIINQSGFPIIYYNQRYVRSFFDGTVELCKRNPDSIDIKISPEPSTSNPIPIENGQKLDVFLTAANQESQPCTGAVLIYVEPGSTGGYGSCQFMLGVLTHQADVNPDLRYFKSSVNGPQASCVNSDGSINAIAQYVNQSEMRFIVIPYVK